MPNDREPKHVILIATDGSAAASTAVDTGLEIAAAVEAPVRFVHAASPLAEEMYEEHPSDGPTRGQIVSADPVLADALTRARDARVDAEAEVLAVERSADLAAAIAGVADGVNASMVIVGSRGRGVIAGSLWGSVSQRLLACASIPVVVVRARRKSQSADARERPPTR